MQAVASAGRRGSTIKFTAAKPIPEALATALVKARIAEQDEADAARGRK